MAHAGSVSVNPKTGKRLGFKLTCVIPGWVVLDDFTITLPCPLRCTCGKQVTLQMSSWPVAMIGRHADAADRAPQHLRGRGHAAVPLGGQSGFPDRLAWARKGHPWLARAFNERGIR